MTDIATPTHDPKAELAVLGAVLLGGSAALDRIETTGIGPDDFYTPMHATIWIACTTLARKGIALDTTTVRSALEASGDLNRMGGPIVLHNAVQECHSALHGGDYATAVVEAAIVRRLAAAGDRVTRIARSERTGQPITDLIDAAQAEIAKIADRHHAGRGGSSMDHALDDLLEALEAGDTPATSTGSVELDEILVGGLRRGTLTTIAARPGQGKTVLGLQMALHAAIVGGLDVGLTSLEMSRQDLLQRALANVASVDYGRIQRSPVVKLTASEWRQLTVATERIRDARIVISPRRSASVADIRADIRAMIRERGKCDLWVIDYLQLVTATDTKVIREQQVSGMTRQLKQLALETGTPIVILAQLNREGAKEKRPPIITDLRESGSIEQDSDNVALLHRPDDGPDIEVIVAKNRRGPRSKFTVEFVGRYQRIAVQVPEATTHTQLSLDNQE